MCVVLTEIVMPHRALHAKKLEEPFGSRSTRAVRVVVDPRISGQDRDPVLTDLLTSRHFEVGLVGRSPDDTIQIHEPDSLHNTIPVTYGSAQTAIWPLDNLLAFAKARAEMYGVDAAELTESLFLLSAVERWDCDFFVSNSDGLHTPGGGYRDVPVLTQEQAVPVLALLLRSRELGRIPGAKWAGGGLAYMPLWWCYKVATVGCLPETRPWRLSFGIDGRRSLVVREDGGDAIGLDLYDELSVDGVTGRFEHALRARDRILRAVLSGGGDENEDLIAYELESLALQLSGALDSAAVVVAGQLNLSEENRQISWSRKEPCRTMRNQWGVPTELTTHWKHLTQAMAVVRNRIHGSPIKSVADLSSQENDVFLALPREERLRLQSHFRDLGGDEAWGLRRDGLLDPWVFTEQAVSQTRTALGQIAAVATRAVVSDTNPEVWPWDAQTTSGTVRLFGLRLQPN